MDLQIRTNGTRISDALQEFIDRRTATIDRVAGNVVDAQLELRTENTRSGTSTTTAQLTIHTGKHLLRAEERADEPAKAIDAAMDKLASQIRKYNGKRLRRRRKDGEHPMTEMGLSTSDDLIPDELDGDVSADDNEDEEELELRVKRFAVKPMIVEEAADQMELLGHDFFLFHNADEGRMNVIYKRRDGAYGLLAPDAS